MDGMRQADAFYAQALPRRLVYRHSNHPYSPVQATATLSSQMLPRNVRLRLIPNHARTRAETGRTSKSGRRAGQETARLQAEAGQRGRETTCAVKAAQTAR